MGWNSLFRPMWLFFSKLGFFLPQVTQQLPEYGVLVHRVLPEKTRPGVDMALGICAKGITIYEVKNNSRIATLRFQWREIGRISTYVSVAQLKNDSCFIFLWSVSSLKEQWVLWSSPDQGSSHTACQLTWPWRPCGIFGRSYQGIWESSGGHFFLTISSPVPHTPMDHHQSKGPYTKAGQNVNQWTAKQF